jgi:hypothetical protein
MLRFFATLTLSAVALALPTHAQGGIGQPPPEFKATKWYNTAPITLEDLKGKTVLIQVFRTW